jgi:lysophospholipase L1-like esterase
MNDSLSKRACGGPLLRGILTAAVFCAALAGCQSSERLPTSYEDLAHASCESIPQEAYPAPNLKVDGHSEFARRHYPVRIAEFKSDPLGCEQIVFLGDSLTERNDWSAKLSTAAAIRNRGISGDTSDGVLARLDEVLISRPSKVFLMIGTNDLWTNNSPRKTADNILDVASRLQERAPEIQVYVQTVLPVRNEPALNRKVEAINNLIRERSATSRVRIIDTYAAFRDSRGLLNENYTDDGVHLTLEGYRVWEELVSNELEKAEFRGR